MASETGADRGNFLRDLPDASGGEVAQELVRDGGLKIERIVSSGQASPEGFWYDQDSSEWVMVLRGRAGLEIEGEDGVLELGPGDWVDLPAHRRHRVAWTARDEPTVWLAIHRSSSAGRAPGVADGP